MRAKVRHFVGRRPVLLAAAVVGVTMLLAAGLFFALRQGGPGQDTATTAPAARTLIAQALDDGRIDYVTSLLYRAYAMVGDNRLPTDYRGPGRTRDDLLLAEASLLPPDARAPLAPFLLRPTSAGSAFAAEPELKRIASTFPRHLAADDCPNGWYSVASSARAASFKVWAQCNGNYRPAVDSALRIADTIWAPMVDLMGPPVADTGTFDAGGDTAVDIYLVGDDEGVFRGGDPQYIEEPDKTLALAFPAPPFSGKRASGFILIGRKLLADKDKFRSTLIHEFFHVLQNAHNWPIQFRASARQDKNGRFIQEENWFVEASATWAEFYFQPDTGARLVHPLFVHSFQPSAFALDVSQPTDHVYAAYIWPYFMQQEAGAAGIAAAWREIENKNDFDGVLDAVDSVVHFRDRFREFAVRNLDLDLNPGDPLAPKYQKLDDKFPYGRPQLTNPDPAEQGLRLVRKEDPPIDIPVGTIDRLSARYLRFVAGTDLGQTTFDFSGLAPASAINVDVVLKIKDKGWERRKVEGNKLRLCRSRKTDNFDELYLILSDHERRSVEGTLTVKSLKEPCSGFEGTVTYQSDSKRHPVGATLNVKLKWKDGEWVDDGGSWTVSGEATSNDGCASVHEEWSGSGDFARDSLRSEGEGSFRLDTAARLFSFDIVGHYAYVSTSCNGPSESLSHEDVTSSGGSITISGEPGERTLSFRLVGRSPQEHISGTLNELGRPPSQ